MRVLVINLTRFGDLLQTQPVVAGLKDQGHEVGLVCLDNFVKASALLSELDAVFGLPGHRFLAGLDANWRTGLERLWRWSRDEVSRFRAEQVLNLTSTLPARLLVRLLANGGGPPPLGFCLDELGFGLNSSPWASFLVAATSRRGCSPFNLVDEFCEVAETPRFDRRFALAAPGREAEAAAGGLLAAAPSDAKGLLAVQLGASNDMRRWPVDRFAALADALWERRGLCPVLLGTGAEAGLGERFRQACGAPAVDCMGRTGLTELAAVLGRCEMLVTNDTGTMHLAAGLGRPVCALFLATAQPWDTGPYLEGSLSLEPDLPCHPCGFSGRCANGLACRRHIGADEVLARVERRLETGSWNGPGESGPGAARAWEARRDEAGFMDLVSLSGHEDDDRTRWVRMQRWFYRHFLDRLPAEPWPEPGNIPRGRTLVEARKVLAAAEAQLTLLVQQARVLEQRPMEAMKAKFMGNWQRLQALWAGSSALSVMGMLWMEQSQQAAGDLTGMTALAGRYLDLVSTWRASLEAQNGTLIE